MILSEYEPIVKSTVSLIKLLRVRVNKETVNETLQSHPDWPSLLCVSDSLRKWNINNAGGRIKAEDFDQLPPPFIAGVKGYDHLVVIVSKVSATHVIYYSPEKRKPISLKKEDFLKNFNGVYLVAEGNQHSGEKNYLKIKRKSLLQSIVVFGLILLLATFSYYQLQSVFVDKLNATIYIQHFVYLVGIIVTSLLLLYEIDKNNPLIRKACMAISKSSCESILTSSHSKILNLVSWSEIGFFYFSGSLLTVLFVPGSLSMLNWLSLIVSPFTIFSLYYQWRVIKQWCIFCLAVVALLLAGGFNASSGSSIQSIPPPSIIILKTVGCFMLPVLCWYSFKPYFLKLQHSIAAKREYLRIKFNGEIFDTLLKKQKSITVPVTDLGIDLGRSGAVHSLVKVCNPYCGYCSTAHSKIEILLERFNDLQVKIILTASEHELSRTVVKHLMAITEQQNDRITKEALDDWYLPEKKDYESFAARHPMNGELFNQDQKLQAMEDWCKKMNVKATPTFFVNGYQLPDAYSIEDLEYFLLE